MIKVRWQRWEQRREGSTNGRDVEMQGGEGGTRRNGLTDFWREEGRLGQVVTPGDPEVLDNQGSREKKGKSDYEGI